MCYKFYIKIDLFVHETLYMVLKNALLQYCQCRRLCPEIAPTYVKAKSF